MTVDEALTTLYRYSRVGVVETSGTIKRDLARMRLARMVLKRELRELGESQEATRMALRELDSRRY